MPELRHACANEVPPLSVLQVWTIWENTLFWSGGYPLLLRWKKTSDFIRKSIGFVMRKSLNQSFVRSLLCGEHSSMGKLCRTLRVWFVRFAKKCICLNLRESDLLNFQKMHLHPWSPLLLPWSLRRQVWLLQIIFLQFHTFLWFRAISIMFFLNSNCVCHESSFHQIDFELHYHIYGHIILCIIMQLSMHHALSWKMILRTRIIWNK